MKKNAIIPALCLLAIFAAAQGTSNYLIVSNMAISPSAEIYAGDNFTLSFDLYNTWAYTADDIAVQLQGGYPFLVISPSQTQKIAFIGSSGQLGYYPLAYNLKVDERAVAGTYPLTAFVSYRTQQETKTALGQSATSATGRTETTPLLINVRGKPKITAGYSIASIQPGAISVINVNLVNEGGDEALSLAVAPGETGDFKLEGTSSFFVGELKAKASAPLSIQFRVNSNAAEGAQEIALNLAYSDKYGKNYSETLSIPVIVGVEEPALTLSVFSSQPSKVRAGDTATLTVRAWNNGDGIAKNVEIVSSDAEPVSVLWPTDRIFVGDIRPDSFATATIQVEIADQARAGEWNLPVKMRFDNANERNHYEQNLSLPVRLERAAKFAVRSSTQDLAPNDKWKQVAFEVENTGNAEATEVKVSLSTQYPITPSGREQYVASLAPGQKANVTFHVDVDSNAVPQTYPVEIFFQWKEGGDTQYTSAKTYFVRVSEAGQSVWLPLAVAAVAVVVLALAARKFLPKKKK